MQEAEAMMKDYLNASRNPNLKRSKIRDASGIFEMEIWSKKNMLVDKVFIDKRAGRFRTVD